MLLAFIFTMGSLFRRGDGRISFEEFTAALKNNGFPEPSHSTYWSFLGAARDYSIFDKQEVAMALSHLIHESDGFVKRRESVNVENYPESYKDASCDFPGQLYYGRGYLKIKHCKNYRDASMNLYGDERLVQDPEAVTRDEETAMNVAFSIWNSKVHDFPGVHEGRFGATTTALTGGSECYIAANSVPARKRFEIYQKVRKAFKLKGKADESGCYELSEFFKASSSENR